MTAAGFQVRRRSQPKPGARQPRRARGFTLLELIVASGMVVVLAVSLASTVRIAFRARRGAEAAVDPIRTAEAAFDVIRADIEGTYYPPAKATLVDNGLAAAAGSPHTIDPTFVANNATDNRGHEGDDLQFYTLADAPEHVCANGEIKWVELTVTTVNDDNGLRPMQDLPVRSDDHLLVRRVTRNLLTIDSQNLVPDTEIICRGVWSFGLRYFDGSDWQQTWDSTDSSTVPAAVEVTLELLRPGANPNSTDPNDVLRFVRVFQIPVSTVSAGTTTTN